MRKLLTAVVLTAVSLFSQITSIPGGGGKGTIPAGRVAFGAGTSTAATDQYFTYQAVPGSPVAGTKWSRAALTGSSTPSGTWYESDVQAELAIERLISTPTSSLSDNFVWITGLLSNIQVNPSAAWNNTNYVDTAGITTYVSSASASTQEISSLNGVSSATYNYGSGDVGSVNGLIGEASHVGAGSVTTIRGGQFNASQTSAAGAVNTLTSGYFGVSTNAVATTVKGVSVFANLSSATISEVYGIVTSANTGGATITTKWDVSAETGWPSRFLGKVAIGESNSAAPTSTLYVKDATASTGATTVQFDIGAGQSSTSTILTLGGVIRFNGQNTTGAGSASLGANSPAVTNTAPYTWIRIVTSDGSTAYIPAWK